MSNRSLFDEEPQDRPESSGWSAAGAPLAERMRPRRLAEVLGQPAVAGPDTFLARAIERDQVPSLIFWGPPGTGKTTILADCLASIDAVERSL